MEDTVTPAQRTQMLSEIAALQAGDGSYDDTLPSPAHHTSTAPVAVRIGYVEGNIVRGDGIEIIGCPSATLTRVMQVAGAMTGLVLVEVVNGAVRVS
jgi:hypothetical protein